MADQNKPATKVENPGPKDESENPKILAPAGTIPTAAQAPGPSLPHPSVDDQKDRNPTPEVAKAQARAEGLPEDDEKDDLPATRGVAEPDGDPIQCIAKKKFFDERGATVKAGATYFYQPRKGVAFPTTVLEPVNRSLASRYLKEAKARDAEKREKQERREASREALRRLAADTE